MRKAKLLTLGCAGVFATIILGTNSARASLIPILDNTLAEFKSVDNYISSILESKLESLADSLGKDIEAAINGTIGTLGLPDVIEARSKIEDIANNPNTVINPVERITNEVDRQITRAVSNSTLGKKGQQNTKQQINNTQTSVEQVQQDAIASQSEVVTQNVMKRIAQQNSQIAGILGAIRTDELKLKQSQDLANLNLTNISRSMDGQKQAHQKELVGQGFSNLRTASQARLF